MTTHGDPGERPTEAVGAQSPSVPPRAGEPQSGVPPTGTVSTGVQGVRDRVHWGPVWAGVLVALPVFVVLQLLLFAFGVLDLGNNGTGQGVTASIVSAVLALIGFFVGGLLAGASVTSRDADAGLLHGVLVWALGTVALIAFGVAGAGALLGSVASAAGQLGPLAAQAPPPPNVDLAQVLQAAHQGAGGAALGLGLTVAAAALGGVLGASLRPHSRTAAH